VREVYGAAKVSERHRHRYEVNNGYRAQLERAGLVVSGESPDRQLVVFVELPRDVHPYYVSTQAHPVFKSRPDRAHPLFAGLVEAALERQRAERLLEVDVVPVTDDVTVVDDVTGALDEVPADLSTSQA
jgi:CTP synthase